MPLGSTVFYFDSFLRNVLVASVTATGSSLSRKNGTGIVSYGLTILGRKNALYMSPQKATITICMLLRGVGILFAVQRRRPVDCMQIKRDSRAERWFWSSETFARLGGDLYRSSFYMVHLGRNRYSRLGLFFTELALFGTDMPQSKVNAPCWMPNKLHYADLPSFTRGIADGSAVLNYDFWRKTNNQNLRQVVNSRWWIKEFFGKGRGLGIPVLPIFQLLPGK